MNPNITQVKRGTLVLFPQNYKFHSNNGKCAQVKGRTLGEAFLKFVASGSFPIPNLTKIEEIGH